MPAKKKAVKKGTAAGTAKTKKPRARKPPRSATKKPLRKVAKKIRALPLSAKQKRAIRRILAGTSPMRPIKEYSKLLKISTPDRVAQYLAQIMKSQKVAGAQEWERPEEIPLNLLSPAAKSALEYLATHAEVAFRKPHGTVFVGAELVSGKKSVLSELARKRLILPVRKEKSGKVRRSSLQRATHFHVPVRRDADPAPPESAFGGLHGRTVFAEHPDKTHLLKGAGAGTSGSKFSYDKKATVTSQSLKGGLLKPEAEHNIYTQKQFLTAYKRLKRQRHPGLLLAEKHGATYFPGIQDIAIFKPTQVPKVYREKIPPKFLDIYPKKERRAAKAAAKWGWQLKTTAKGKAYNMPPRIAGEQRLMHYTLKTPFRLQNIEEVAIKRILPLYGMEMSGKSIYLKTTKGGRTRRKKITNAKAAEIAINGFAARQGLMFLIAKTCASSVRSSPEPGFSIFSGHNTAIDGSTMDWDVVGFGERLLAGQKLNWESVERRLIEEHIEAFSKAVTKKLGIPYYPGSYRVFGVDANTLFRNIIAD